MNGSRGGIDLHAHFWPRGLVEAAHSNGSWHGWTPTLTDDGQLRIGHSGRVVPLPVPTVDDIDRETRMRRRQQNAIHIEALMPAGFLWSYELAPAVGAAACREMNDEMAAAQQAAPDRVRALACLPLQDTELAIAEANRCMNELDLRSFSAASSINGANLDDQAVVPVLDHLAAADCSLSIHPPYWEKLGAERFPRHLFATSFGPHFEAALATASLIMSGIFDRFPQARIAVSHGGGALQFAIGRLDAVYERRPSTRTTVEPPSAYLSKLYYDCLVHDARSLQLLIDRVGSDKVMVGTDFPFDWDSPGGTVGWLRALPFLDDRQKEQLVAGNAARFLRLDSGTDRAA